MRTHTRLCILLSSWIATDAIAVTVYHQIPLAVSLETQTVSSDAANYTGAAAYNPTVLNPPPVPDPLPNMNFGIQLITGGTPGASILQSGAFLGFSVEMSVVNQILGKNSSYLSVPFLNLMGNIVRRAQQVRVRVGGNTQDSAVLVDSLPGGKMLQKDIAAGSNPTQTPPLDYTNDMLYLMRNISDFVNVRWYLGIPFNDSSNWRLAIAEHGQAILGDYLLGLQVGNEPDLYQRHGHRPDGYAPQDYVNEFSSLVTTMSTNTVPLNTGMLIGPNLAGEWAPEQIWDTGFVDAYMDNLAYLAVEHYPTDNCFAQFNIGTYHDPQETFSDFLNHASGQNIVQPYLNSTAYAQTKNKPFLMFETNTASCGGFAGISDSFGAALWALDYGMQMAHSNFTGALFHIGGQNVFYNPFTPPPTNQSTFRQWTIGPLYYSVIAMAEALGSSNKSQIMDLNANEANTYTPAYAIYEDGNPVRVALFNFITDPTGASDYTANIAIGGGDSGQSSNTPSSVRVKYLKADSVSQKANFTWAGQTFGGHFDSDGRMMGDEDIQTVACDTVTACAIKVPAPGFALVFLAGDVYSDTAEVMTTFTTSMYTRTMNTVIVDPQVLATSNGHKAMSELRGSTSAENGGMKVGVSLSGILVIGMMVWGTARLR